MKRTRGDLYTYQEKAIEYLASKKRCGLWLDMGMGKTVITLTAVSDLLDGFLVDKVLIISPLLVAKSVWREEALNWTHTEHLTFSKCYGNKEARENAINANANVYLINKENVRWLVGKYRKKWPFDCVIIDEASGFKNNESKRVTSIKSILCKTRRMILLTGTPAPNSYLDLWSQTFLIDGGERLGKTMSSYKNRYFYANHNGYGFSLREGAREMINTKILDVYMSLKLGDYFYDINVVTSNRYAKLSKEVELIYRSLKREFKVIINNSEKLIATSAAALANKLIQFSNGAVYKEDSKEYVTIHDEKLDLLEKLTKEHPKDNFLVAYNFVSDKERLLKKFPFAVPLGQDDGVIDRWNNKEIRMLIAHPASAGHGLNLQQGGKIVVWFGLPWSLELYKQFNARLVRQGQKDTVKVIHLITENTIDNKILSVLKSKDNCQNALLDALKVHINS